MVAAALLLLRGAYQSTAAVAAGAWPRTALGNGREVGGKTLGLVGFGSIGQLTARLARGVGMHVIAFDAMLDADHPAFAEAGVRATTLDELVRKRRRDQPARAAGRFDPRLCSTRARIAAMKQGAISINTARGGIVDEAALAAALRERASRRRRARRLRARAAAGRQRISPAARTCC